MSETKYINWNQMSELGLIYKINKEILHPIGLSISRNPENGHSEAILIADDGAWCYDENPNRVILSSKEIQIKINEIINKDK